MENQFTRIGQLIYDLQAGEPLDDTGFEAFFNEEFRRITMQLAAHWYKNEKGTLYGLEFHHVENNRLLEKVNALYLRDTACNAFGENLDDLYRLLIDHLNIQGVRIDKMIAEPASSALDFPDSGMPLGHQLMIDKRLEQIKPAAYMSRLFSPLTIKEITLKNRIVVSPMCQYSATDGFATDWHLVHLGSRAVGGAGLIIQEATAISPEGRISHKDLGLWQDEHIDKLKQIVSFIHENGSVAGIQLSHAGRKASVEVPWKGGAQITQGENGWQPCGPSAIPFKNDQKLLPKELTTAEINQIIIQFRDAAFRAEQAGYRVLEIHAAHGYLLHQFLSPISNLRSDEYGGSFENRIRLTLEVVAAVKTAWPENLPLFVRLSATDYTEGGWDEDESVQLSARLKGMGVDLIDVSSGGNVPELKIPLSLGYQVAFSKRIKKEAGIKTGAVGLITTAVQAELILEKQAADLIFIARASLRDPYFPINAAGGLGVDLPWPDQYLRAKR